MTEEELRNIFGTHFRNASLQDLTLLFSCRTLLREINLSAPGESFLRTKAFQELLGYMGKDVHIQPPFYCDFGKNIEIGDGSFLNFNCTILDCAPVRIGKRAWIAPQVQIYAASHPVDAVERRSRCTASPVSIGDDVWLGGGVIVCPGVTIGDRAVIGAGSVVTGDIPSDVVAYGNPCRVQRKLGDAAGNKGDG
jgi:maltose O-acetyltransferase